MSFVRWIFYDPDTGEVKYSGMQRGEFIHVSTEEAAEAFGVSGAACMEWRTPDPEIEAAFAPVDDAGNPRVVNVSVDVLGEEPQLVFSYEPVPEPQGNIYEDYYNAMSSELGGI